MTRHDRALLLVLTAGLLALSACGTPDAQRPTATAIVITATPLPNDTSTPERAPLPSPTAGQDLPEGETNTPTATEPPPSPILTVPLTATLTATLTPTITPTPTVTATLTPAGTLTPTPTASLTPIKLVVQSDVGSYVRTGPGTNYPVAGVVEARAMFDALAYTIDTDGDAWYLIELADGTRAWLSQWVAGRVDDVPLGLIALAATVPASPTLPPTATFTPTPTITATPTLPSGANARIHDDSKANLRSGPGLNYTQLGMMDPGDPLFVMGRNTNGTWFEVNTFDGRNGWVWGELIVLVGVEVAALPLRWVNPDTPPGIVLTADRLQNAYQIFERGQQIGNRTNTWIVVGDSTSAMTDEWYSLFYAVARGGFSVGPYTNLQQTINFYAPSGKFGASFQSAQSGFATDYVLDPMWANPGVCQTGESPLTCEIRLSQPAFAIIYIGIVDMANYNNAPLYQQNLEVIVTTLINSGVIPVLTTFSIDEGHGVNAPFLTTYQQQQAIIRDMAARRQLPLIEFQQAALALPHQGCIEDGRHLYYNLDGSLDLGDDNRLGQALRERMTLQMMDALRVYVFGG